MPFGYQKPLLTAIASLVLVLPTWAIEPPKDNDEQTEEQNSTHMTESLRGAVRNIVVLPTASPAGREITGSYKEETAGLSGGMSKGSEIGRGVGTDIGGIPVRIPFPILTLPGALIGGISGATQREIQNFRDRLTADLAEAASQPLSNDALASDVFWGVRNIPTLNTKVLTLTAPIPEDTDAILYVSLEGMTIDVQGKDAIITTTAKATLRRLSDGTDLYEREVRYQDRDTLSEWTKDNNALWRGYANFARHFIGREIAAEVFGKIDLQRELKPVPNKTMKRVKKNDWHGTSRSSSPALSWQLNTLPGDASLGPWANPTNAADVLFDVEIYDQHRPVYSASDVPGTEHTVSEELERCKTYRWSVRPIYRIGNDIRFGDWMRFEMATDTGNGSIGVRASDAHAYIQDFARLEVKCR